MKKLFRLSFLVLFAIINPAFAKEKLIVYAAASTSKAVSEIIENYNHSNSDVQAKASFASSSILAKQIEAGAPAHIYISANPKWMDYLQERKLIKNETRKNLLSNQLVLISPKGKSFDVELKGQFNFADKLKGKLCLGDPDHVPVGIYAKQALSSLGWWEQVKPSVVGSKDVRAALVLVERGECAAGVVYSTDAKASVLVDLMAELPVESHSPIVYPVAMLNSAPDLADHFLTYLKSPEAKAIFIKYGFTTTTQ